MKCLILIFLLSCTANTYAQEYSRDGMSIDTEELSRKLQEHTRAVSSTSDLHLIPRGVLLRGAYRMVIGKKRFFSRDPNTAPSLSLLQGEPENFFSVRSAEILLNACAEIVSQENEASDIVSIAEKIMLAEEVEYEDLERHYDQLISDLPADDRAEVESILARGGVNASHSRIDWVSMAQDVPDLAEFLIRHGCSNNGGLRR